MPWQHYILEYSRSLAWKQAHGDQLPSLMFPIVFFLSSFPCLAAVEKIVQCLSPAMSFLVATLFSWSVFFLFYLRPMHAFLMVDSYVYCVIRLVSHPWIIRHALQSIGPSYPTTHYFSFKLIFHHGWWKIASRIRYDCFRKWRRTWLMSYWFMVIRYMSGWCLLSIFDVFDVLDKSLKQDMVTMEKFIITSYDTENKGFEHT